MHPVTVAVYSAATSAYNSRHSTVCTTDGNPSALAAKNTHPSHTGMAERNRRSLPSHRRISTNVMFAAKGRRIWRHQKGREREDSPQTHTMRATAEQIMHSAERITGAVNPGR